ncbi:hypothetical protein [Sphingobium sp. CCH11-B1]|uniref:hypothetical protein n=1 Tax=Sphingobium sp. CCH11-B1 TaxID=1768781 RepID=UPI00082F5EBB|nr:hypothetical protein [Sphingobium sp. CCH11-B1]
MKTDRTTGLVAFISTLIAVVLLSKIGGSGADLAIMTGLIGVLGMLAPGLVPSRGNDRRVTIDQPADSPVPVETKP